MIRHDASKPHLATWSGMDHLNGQTRCHGNRRWRRAKRHQKSYRQSRSYWNNRCANFDGRSALYSHVIEPLPPSALATNGGVPRIRSRLIKASCSACLTKQSCLVTVDTGRGLKSVHACNASTTMRWIKVPANSHYRRYRACMLLAGRNDSSKSLYGGLEQDTPLPCTILGVTMELKGK